MGVVMVVVLIGLRLIVELMFNDFIGMCFDQVIN